MLYRASDNTVRGVEDIALDERSHSIDHNRSTSSDSSGKSRDDPIILEDVYSRYLETDSDSGSGNRAKSAQVDAGLFSSPETASESGIPVSPSSPKGPFHVVDNDFPETAQRVQRAKQSFDVRFLASLERVTARPH